MKQLVEFKLEDGNTIMVEVEQPEAQGGTIRAGRKPGEIYYEATQTFEQALEKI